MGSRTSIFAIAITLIAALSAPQGAFAQQGGGGTGTGGAPGTTLAPIPPRGGEIDLPIGNPVRGAEDIPPTPPPDEDDPEVPKIYDEDIPTANDSIIYVLDISGSMDWDNHTYTGLDGQQRNGPRIDRAKCELIRSIQGLSKDFEFNVYAFDCDLRRWSGAKQKADPGPKAAAIQWVSGLQPDGATGTGPAVAAALGDKSNLTVVLLSDGAPNCGANGMGGHRNMIRSANTQHAAVHCFGIACYGSFESFMRGVASDSGGQYYPVP